VRIAIDASRAASTVRTGTENYSREIITGLAGVDPVDDYTLYYNEGDLGGLGLAGRFSARRIPFPRAWTHIRLSAALVQDRPDVLFVPAHVLPAVCPVPALVTIHDLGYRYFPEAHSKSRYLALEASTWFSSRYADRIIAISEATKRDLMGFYGVSGRKITVVYHGYDKRYHQRTEEEILPAIAKYGLERPYFLHVGTLQPRKNIIRLVEAFDRFKERGRPHQIALVGKKGWLYDSIASAVQKSTSAECIVQPGYVDAQDLPALVDGAEALIIPSLYEGFGLPALEAMASGTPVIASNSSSLPEVVGDAGLLVDPTDVSAIAAAMESVAASADLRAELRAKGRARATTFSWERCARETLEVLKKTGNS
jgi:glycosyltransferase involved in cell wall biosynthesis